MNRFNKTETAIFPMHAVVSEDFLFSLFIGLNVCGYNFLVDMLFVFLQGKSKMYKSIRWLVETHFFDVKNC